MPISNISTCLEMYSHIGKFESLEEGGREREREEEQWREGRGDGERGARDGGAVT